ncbi:glycosyltransferase family 2 protein [Erythrobacter sp.]|uniref:glycosyltransferase family 2 protein n=1 Tax=Erythrobacter sp. TaxID=1042 RepID=UPI0025ECBF9E|nr:glycosyltransferase family 2 protein [Erythrobacter sp.]
MIDPLLRCQGGFVRVDLGQAAGLRQHSSDQLHGKIPVSASGIRKIADAWLTLRVHLEAFRAAPGPYLTAMKWWILRKRVRARGQLAPLLGRTSLAYEWWVLREDAKARPASPPQEPPIIGLIYGTASFAHAAETLASLKAENITSFVVDSNNQNALRQVVTAIDWSASPWLLPIAAGDCIAPGAARAYRAAIAEDDRSAYFADDDLLDGLGRRTDPHFKPNWNPELHAHFDYLTGACIVKGNRPILAALADEKDWAPFLIGQATADGAKHLPLVLHHRRGRPTPCVPAAIASRSSSLPDLSVIIPTRNQVDLLRICLEGLYTVNYPAIEIIIVDNDSDEPATLQFLAELAKRGVKVLRHAGEFNYSAINNRAVAEASGELVCLLNNDIEMLSADWLASMAAQALRDDVGAVGAQLLYPDGRIQHAGVVIGVGNAAGHAHRLLDPGSQGYFCRHSLPQFVSAVTAACLVVRRDRFLAVGGLDEDNFPVAFNDVDLCLKLNQRGWQSFYEPRAVLIHHESVSRGHDVDPIGAARFAGELAALKRIWKTDEIVDPYHHPHLSRASEQFAVAL